MDLLHTQTVKLLFASASDFENKTPYSIDYRNSPSGNPADGSAAFEIETTSYYITRHMGLQ